MIYSYSDPYVAPESTEGATAWIRERWAEFEALSPAIIDLQHRAALAAQAYEARGNTIQADAARLLVRELAKLQQIHHQVLTWAEGIADTLGIGAVQIPLGIAGVSVAAILMVWVFRKYAAQERALELLEAGILTPEQFRELDILDPPGIGTDIGSIAGSLGKWVLLGVLALVVLEGVKRGRIFGENPPLLLMGNPPDIMADNVGFIGYQHAQDGEWYLHEFDAGVRMETEPDGSLRIYHPSNSLWKDF